MRKVVQKVASLWMRRAISEEALEEVRNHMRSGDFSFENIFGDNLRIAVPVPDLKKYLSNYTKGDIQKYLKELGHEFPGAKWNWGKGLLTTSDGQDLKIGKVIAKAQRRFVKKNPEAWSALKNLIKERRKYEKASQDFAGYVEGPLTTSMREVSERSYNDFDPRGLASLLTFLKRRRGDRDWRAAQEALDTSLGYVPKLSTLSQEKWRDGMLEVLQVSDEDLEHLRTHLKELGKEIEKKNEEAKRLNAEGKKLKNEGNSEGAEKLLEQAKKLNREMGNLLEDRYSGYRILETVLYVYPYWDKDHKEALARSIRRSTNDLIGAHKSLDEAVGEHLKQMRGLEEDEQTEAKVLQRLEDARQTYDNWKGSSKGALYMIVSRAPVDVLRMSDHPTAAQAIESCHSEGSSYFHCAVEEAKGAGLVGYIVPKEDLNKIDLEDEEVFFDKDRGVDGVKPLARIRFRRFENIHDASELAIPEIRGYGVDYDNLVETATEWAREAQKETFEQRPPMSDYVLTGGFYRDHFDGVLFNNFFDDQKEERENTKHQPKEKKPEPVKEQGSLTTALYNKDFWNWMEEKHPKIPNPNRDGREETIAPATLKSYSQRAAPYAQKARDLVQNYYGAYRSFKTAQTVSSLWMRRAISEEALEDMLGRVEPEDLPFDHIFQGRRRLVVDPKQFGGLGAVQPPSAEDIRRFLFNTKTVKSTDKIDWKKGLIYDEDGEVKFRVGKALNKALRKAVGKELPLFRTMAKIESQRKKPDSFLGRTVGTYETSLLKGLASMGSFTDEKFPADQVYKEIETFGVPSPQSWKKLREVAKTFSQMPEKDRAALAEKHEKAYESQGSKVPDEYHKRYWDARGVYSSFRNDRKPKDPDIFRHFRKWIDNTDQLYEGPEGEGVRKLFELGEGVPEERLNQLKSLSSLEQEKQNYATWKSLYGKDLSIVVSRDPVDVLRMSDHPKAVQAIESCHSEGSSEFECAVKEAEEGGLIAYVVRKEDIEGKDLDEGELFEDHDREIKGIKPYARLRFRRFEKGSGNDGVEVAVPETSDKVYGAAFENFHKVMKDWAKKEQSEFYYGDSPYSRDPSEWRLTGGTYTDTESSDLFDAFFENSDEEEEYPFWKDEPTEDQYDPYGEGYTPEDSPYLQDNDYDEHYYGDAKHGPREVRPRKDLDRLGIFWEWMKRYHPKVPNPNPRGREKEITPNTLKSYARSNTSYASRARQALSGYLEEFQKSGQGGMSDSELSLIKGRLASSKDPKFWVWMKDNHEQVPNPNRNGKETIRPSTLQSYSRSGDARIKEQAERIVQRYYAQWVQQNQQEQGNNAKRSKGPKVKDPLFHTTSYAALEEIAEHGLTPRSGGGTFSHGGYGEHSQGKVFLSENPTAARNWQDKVFQQLEHQHGDEQDEGLGRRVPVMLRVKNRKTKVDPVGDKDVPGSRFTTKAIDPDEIEFWNPEKEEWMPVSEWESVSPEAAVSSRDEDGVYVEDSAFMPGDDDAYDRDDAAIRKERFRQQEQERAKADQERAKQLAEQEKAKWLEPETRQYWIDKIKRDGAKAPIPMGKDWGIPGVFPEMWQKRLQVDRDGNLLKKAEASNFWDWLEKKHAEVPNPNPKGKSKIRPSTLKTYTENEDPQIQERARNIVQKYYAQWMMEDEDEASPVPAQQQAEAYSVPLRDTGEETWSGGKIFDTDVSKDTFVHFTPRSRAKQILESGKLLAKPPYKKFGIEGVQAVSAGYGSFVPEVQTTHSKNTKEDPLVAVVFKTNTAPEHGHPEEVHWDKDVELSNARIVDFNGAKSLLEQAPNKISEDDMVVYKSSDSSYDPVFLDWSRGMRFPQKGSKQRVPFADLDKESKDSVYQRWERMTKGEDAERVQKENRALSGNTNPKRYEKVKFELKFDESTKASDLKKIESVFGTSDQEEIKNRVLDLAGAGGASKFVDSAFVLLWPSSGGGVSMKVIGGGDQEAEDGAMVRFERTIHFSKTEDKDKPYKPSYVENNFFSSKNTPSGVGTRVFASQVASAKKEGFSQISTEASRGTGLNGYYTWPRLGYNGPLKKDFFEKLQKENPEAARQVQELAELDPNRTWKGAPAELFHVMAIPEARQWWEKEGNTFSATFFVNEEFDGGKGYEVLKRYTEAKAMVEGKTIPEYISKIGAKGKNVAPALTDQDQELLDRVWARVRREIESKARENAGNSKKAQELAQFWVWTKVVKSALEL